MKKETAEWISIASEELMAAKHLEKLNLHRMVCYHCQQCVEKALKAFLVEKDKEFQRTHNILDLKNMVVASGVDIPLTNDEAVFLKNNNIL